MAELTDIRDAVRARYANAAKAAEARARRPDATGRLLRLVCAGHMLPRR